MFNNREKLDTKKCCVFFVYIYDFEQERWFELNKAPITNGMYRFSNRFYAYAHESCLQNLSTIVGKALK